MTGTAALGFIPTHKEEPTDNASMEEQKKGTRSLDKQLAQILGKPLSESSDEPRARGNKKIGCFEKKWELEEET